MVETVAEIAEDELRQMIAEVVEEKLILVRVIRHGRDTYKG